MSKYSTIDNRIFNDYVKVNRIVSGENPEELPNIEETLSLGLSDIKNVSKDNESGLREKKAIIGLMVPIIKNIYNYRCHENKEDGGRRSPLGIQHVKNYYNINPSWDKMPSKLQCETLMSILKNINSEMKERAKYLSKYSKLGRFVTTIPDIMSCPSRRVIKSKTSKRTKKRKNRMLKMAAQGFQKEQLKTEQRRKHFPIQGGRKKKTRKVNKLSLSDYRKILKFYKMKIPKSASKIRKEGNKIIAKKFCSCIKKVRKKFKKEGIAIGICTKSVITRKNIKRGSFNCKTKTRIDLYKGGSKKSKKNINQSGGGGDTLFENAKRIAIEMAQIKPILDGVISTSNKTASQKNNLRLKVTSKKIIEEIKKVTLKDFNKSLVKMKEKYYKEPKIQKKQRGGQGEEKCPICAEDHGNSIVEGNWPYVCDWSGHGAQFCNACLSDLLSDRVPICPLCRAPKKSDVIIQTIANNLEEQRFIEAQIADEIEEEQRFIEAQIADEIEEERLEQELIDSRRSNEQVIMGLGLFYTVIYSFSYSVLGENPNFLWSLIPLMHMYHIYNRVPREEEEEDAIVIGADRMRRVREIESAIRYATRNEEPWTEEHTRSYALEMEGITQGQHVPRRLQRTLATYNTIGRLREALTHLYGNYARWRPPTRGGKKKTRKKRGGQSGKKLTLQEFNKRIKERTEQLRTSPITASIGNSLPKEVRQFTTSPINVPNQDEGKDKNGGHQRPLISHPHDDEEYGGGNKSKKIKDIINIFKQYPDIFPRGYFRYLPATLEKHDKKGTLIYNNGVVLTYTKYKKTVNKYKKYKIKPGDVKLNQLVNKNQGNGKAKKIFLKFMKTHKDSNLLLDVLASNKKAIKFYRKNGFKKIDDTKFGDKLKGIVMLKRSKKNKTRKKKN